RDDRRRPGDAGKSEGGSLPFGQRFTRTLEMITNNLLGQIESTLTKSSEPDTIHALDSGAQLLHLTAQIGLPPQMLDVVKTIPVGKGIAGQTVAQNKPVTICNLQTDASGVAKPGARQTGVGGALCVPMRREGKIVGALGIGTMRQHEYTAEETDNLENIAALIAARLTPG